MRRLQNAIDLEHIAWHRGSAFGRHATPQPTQIDFENNLSIALLKYRANGNPPLLFEDESKAIGSRHIPNILFERLKQSPLVVLDVEDEERAKITFDEYVVEAQLEYRRLHGDEAGLNDWADSILNSIERIKKRLGGVRHAEIREQFDAAMRHQRQTGDNGRHQAWVSALLFEYYDPMYDYQIKNNRKRIIYSGDADAVIQYLIDKNLTKLKPDAAV